LLICARWSVRSPANPRPGSSSSGSRGRCGDFFSSKNLCSATRVIGSGNLVVLSAPTYRPTQRRRRRRRRIIHNQ
jgi:hypothetical protein